MGDPRLETILNRTMSFYQHTAVPRRFIMSLTLLALVSLRTEASVILPNSSKRGALSVKSSKGSMVPEMQKRLEDVLAEQSNGTKGLEDKIKAIRDIIERQTNKYRKRNKQPTTDPISSPIQKDLGDHPTRTGSGASAAGKGEAVGAGAGSEAQLTKDLKKLQKELKPIHLDYKAACSKYIETVPPQKIEQDENRVLCVPKKTLKDELGLTDAKWKEILELSKKIRKLTQTVQELRMKIGATENKLLKVASE